jgi:Fe-S-cluster-containing hydrogenase component 2
MNCVHLCPVQAIKLKEKGMWIDEEKCIGCGSCEKQCASEAITKKEIKP